MYTHRHVCERKRGTEEPRNWKGLGDHPGPVPAFTHGETEAQIGERTRLRSGSWVSCALVTEEREFFSHYSLTTLDLESWIGLSRPSGRSLFAPRD